jgi:hypothetical protein
MGRAQVQRMLLRHGAVGPGGRSIEGFCGGMNYAAITSPRTTQTGTRAPAPCLPRTRVAR